VSEDLRFPKNEADFNLLKALGKDRAIKSISFDFEPEPNNTKLWGI